MTYLSMKIMTKKSLKNQLITFLTSRINTLLETMKLEPLLKPKIETFKVT